MSDSVATSQVASSHAAIKKPAFLAGVFLTTFSVLVFQIVQTRILSVIAWYYLAFFAISVAMLGMTIGAVWVYLRRDRFLPDRLASDLSRYALATAVSIPASMMVQFSLITTLALSAIDHRLLGPAAGGHDSPVCLCRCRGQSGADAKPVPGEPGLWRGSAGCRAGLRRGGAAAQRAGWTDDADRYRTHRSVGRLLFHSQCQRRGTSSSSMLASGGKDLSR